MSDIRSTILATPNGQEQYDAICKEILSNRQILARILKRFVKEYRNCSIQDIEEKYIEPESIKISAEPVERNLTNTHIIGINTEERTINEGTVFYDIMFRALYPNGRGKEIGLIVNLEAQSDFYPGYKIETRGVYYAVRKLTSELKVIGRDTDYSLLEKVYSIWLCIGKNVPKKESNTATLYEIRKNDIIGSVEREEQCYDLLSVIIVRMGNNEVSQDNVLKLIQTLFDQGIEKREKLKKLRELGIQINHVIEERVKHICTLGEELYESAAEKTKKEMVLAMYKKYIAINEIAEIARIPVKMTEQWISEAEQA